MNESKIKTVFEERDELRRENELLKARLAATEEALAQVQRESAALRAKWDKVLDELREKILGEFRIIAIDLHVHKHYAVTGIRWEDCEDCAGVRAMLPEYAPALSPSQQAAIDRGIAGAEEVGEMWERN